MRLIDADELLKAIANSGLVWETNECLDVIEVLVVKKIIDDAPTIEERPKGEWKYCGMGVHSCTNCGAEYEAGICDHCNVNNSEFKFCPNCGADMREGEV